MTAENREDVFTHSLPRELRSQLGCYVYMYIDPRDDLPFYVGKGIGDRVLDHMGESGESEKIGRIDALRTKKQKDLLLQQRQLVRALLKRFDRYFKTNNTF